MFQGQGTAQQVAGLTARLEAQELELGRSSPEYGPHLQVRKASLQDLRASLPAQSALIDFREYHPEDFKTGTLGEPRWAGVLIPADGAGEIQVRDLGATAETAPLLKAILADTDSGTATARALYQQLLTPFTTELAKLHRLYVAPDGDLYLLAFGLLRDPEGRRVLDTLDLRLVQSGRDLLRAPPNRSPKGLIAVGGIDFDLSKPSRPMATEDAGLTRVRASMADAFRGGFKPLAYTKQEVAEIEALYRILRPDETVTIVEGAQPTKSWLFSQPPPRVLHLATHGFYRKPNEPADRPMLLAGIALAGANRSLQRGDQDGILYALEAQDLNLEDTELVVLSACETAQGQIDYGDGISGLVRALRNAGVRNVLVALHPVNDQGAAEFMQRFYFYWLKQTRSDPAAALRDAQREQVTIANPDTTWTNFLIIGG